MVFEQAGTGGFHGFEDAVASQLRGAFDEGDFAGAFQAAEFVEDGGEVFDFGAGLANCCSRERRPSQGSREIAALALRSCQLGIVGREHPAFALFQAAVARREEEGGFAGATVEEQERVGGLDAGEVVKLVRLAGVRKAAFEPVALDQRDGLGPNAAVNFRPAGGELPGGGSRFESASGFGREE